MKSLSMEEKIQEFDDNGFHLEAKTLRKVTTPRKPKDYGWWRKTFDPSNEKDRRSMRKIERSAEFYPSGAAGINYLPLGDHNRRCPLGVDIYTPFGWNMLKPCIDAFNRGETIWMESGE